MKTLLRAVAVLAALEAPDETNPSAFKANTRLQISSAGATSDLLALLSATLEG